MSHGHAPGTGVNAGVAFSDVGGVLARHLQVERNASALTIHPRLTYRIT